MIDIKDISSYIQQSTRNKIVFCREEIDGIRFIDVGMQLSLLMGENPVEMPGFETMYRQILNRSSVHDIIGPYLAIANIGILFEPELKLDVQSIINQYSRNQCLIIKIEAEIENDILYFLSISDNVHVNLHGLSYIQI